MLMEKVDRKVIIEDLIGQLEGQIAEGIRSFQANRAISQNAPSKMESRYDTRKYEYGVVADGLAEMVLEMQEALKTLRRRRVTPDGDVIREGHLVLVDVEETPGWDEEEEEEEEARRKAQGKAGPQAETKAPAVEPTVSRYEVMYLLLDRSCGDDAEAVRIVSAASPLGKELLGRKVGDLVTIRIGTSRRTRRTLRCRIKEIG